MQIRALRLLNFRQHADTRIRFGTGLIGIVGPNGAGKSTLLEAIAWALYGNPAARGTKDSIRRRTAPARSSVEVELEFVLGVHAYRIVRTPNKAELFQDGEGSPIANSTGAVTDKITRLIGMNREEFFNTYFTGQKELAIMAAMSAPDRAKFLSRVLGYERLAVAQNKLRDKRLELKAALATAEAGLIDLATLEREEAQAAARLETASQQLAGSRSELDAAVAAVETRRPEWLSWEKKREQAMAVDADRQIAEHQLVEARRTLETVTRDLAEARIAAQKRDELVPRLVDWDALLVERDRLDREAQAFAGRRGIEAQVTEIRRNVTALEAALAKLPAEDELKAIHATLSEAVEQRQKAGAVVESRRAEWVRERQNAETKKKDLGDQGRELKEQRKLLRKAGGEGACPTCGKPLGDTYTAVLDDIQARIDEVLLQWNYYDSRLKQLEREPPELRQAVEHLEEVEGLVKARTEALGKTQAGIAERARSERAREEFRTRLAGLESELAAVPASYDEAAHRAVRARIAELEPVRDQVARLGSLADRLGGLSERAVQAEAAVAAAGAKLGDAEARGQALGWSPETYQRLQREFRAAEERSRTAERESIRAEAERQAAIEHRAGLARRRQERDDRLATIAAIRLDHAEAEELNAGFTGLRDELNDGLRPDLADAASVHLRALTNGRYSDLEIDDDYQAVVIEDGEPLRVISGGEEDVINLALRLAISQMIADRAGQPFSLLVLDEVFGSLDEDRRASVVDLLRTLADRFPQVILITHIESIRDGFDRLIRIEADSETGIARVREEQPSNDELANVAA